MPGGEPAVLSVEAVWHHFGVRPVLRGVDLSVHRGELLCVLGPNGSGKSTLLSIMAGVRPPVEGRVCVEGVERRSSVESEQAIREKLVYLPAEPWVPLRHTPREFLCAVGRLYGVGERRLFEHVDRLLDLLDLTEAGDQPIDALSTGQRKKAAVASALVTDASIFVFDEPFSGGLDPPALHALQGVFAELAKRADVTIVVAVPVPELVQAFATRVAIIRDGELTTIGTVAELTAEAGLPTNATFATVADKLMGSDSSAKLERYFAGSDDAT